MSDKQFLVLGYSLLNNELFRKTMASNKGIEMTYLWLRKNIIRAPMTNMYANEVYKEYFLKGKLAASICEENLCKKLFLSRPTLNKNLKILESKGFLSIKELKYKTRGESQKSQKVYILGKWKPAIDAAGDEYVKEYMMVFDLIVNDKLAENTIEDYC